MRSNCMIFAVCFCWGDCYRVSFSRGQRAWRLCPRLLSTAPPSQLGFESEQLENLERPFFSIFQTWSLKSDWFGKGSFQTCYEENHFVLKQKLKPVLDSCTPRPLCGLDAHLDRDDFFWDSEAAVISLENAQQTRLYYLWNVMKHFQKFSKCLLPYWEKHIFRPRDCGCHYTHTPFVFARNFSCNTIMSSKVHSIWTDQDFANAEKVATAADFIFKGIHDKAAKHARCASRECHDDSVSSWKEGVRVSQELKDRGAAWEAARYVGYGFSWVRVTAVTAG